MTLAHTSEVRMEQDSSFKERNEFYSSYPPELSSTSAFNYYAQMRDSHPCPHASLQSQWKRNTAFLNPAADRN